MAIQPFMKSTKFFQQRRSYQYTAYGKYNKLGTLHQLNVFLSDSSCGFFEEEVHDDENDDKNDDGHDDDDDEIEFDSDYHSLAQAYLHLFLKYGRTVGNENQRLRQLRLTLLKRLIKLCFSSATSEEIVLEMWQLESGATVEGTSDCLPTMDVHTYLNLCNFGNKSKYFFS